MAVNLIFKSNVPGARVVRLMSLRSGRFVNRFFASAAFFPAYRAVKLPLITPDTKISWAWNLPKSN